MDEGSRNEERLRRMINSGEELLYFSREGREAFFSDRKTNHAIRDCLKDFTEEADKLVKPLRRANQRIDWEELVELRQKAHHRYYRLSDEDIWDFVNNALDRYLRALRRLRLA
jgi:uncharacterized protein with HEPN domain